MHAEFFKLYRTTGSLPDIKEIVDARRKTVLAGVAIVFSGIIPLGLPPDRFELWRLAEMFGATCDTSIWCGTTHVISFRSDTDKVMQAVEAGIPVVKPDWLLACFRQWQRVPVEGFVVEGIQSRPPSEHELSIGSDVEFDPAELQAMNDELAELEQSYDSDSDEDAEPSSKRRRSEVSQSTDASFVEELERDLL